MASRPCRTLCCKATSIKVGRRERPFRVLWNVALASSSGCSSSSWSWSCSGISGRGSSLVGGLPLAFSKCTSRSRNATRSDGCNIPAATSGMVYSLSSSVEEEVAQGISKEEQHVVIGFGVHKSYVFFS